MPPGELRDAENSENCFGKNNTKSIGAITQQ